MDPNSPPPSGQPASAPPAGMTAQQVEQQFQEMQQQQGQMASPLQASQAQQAELEATVVNLQRQLNAQAAQVQAVAPSNPFKGNDLLKQVVKPPKPLSEKGAADWERFVFSVETFMALMDERYPEYLDEARKA